MTEYLFDYFEEDVDVDTSTVPVPIVKPPARNIVTLDDLDDLDGEVKVYDYTRENFDRSQADRYYEKSSITLRPYQNEAVEATFREWLKGNWSTLILMATATGKTFVMAGLARRYQEVFGIRSDGKPRRGLFLAHRDYLLGQIANAMAAFGLESAIEQGKKKARASLFDDVDIVIASVQSMQGNRLKRTYPRDHFDYIVTDEGHHGPAQTYRNVYKYFRPYAAHRAFLTATPKRMDDERLEDLCHSRAFVFDIKDAVAYSPPPICTNIRVAYCNTKVDISNIRTTGLDLNEDDIAESIAPYIIPIARAIKKEVGDRTFVGFWPDVGCSQAITSALGEKDGLGMSVAHLDANSRDQEEVLKAFKEGYFQGLNNCAKFGEGFDLPDVSCVILGRPTFSESMLKQMIGRGLRKKTGKHRDLLIIDFPWVVGSHSILRPADVFIGNVNHEEVYQEVEAALETDGGTDDLLAAITRADQVVKERRQIEVKASDGRVQYTKAEFDLLGEHANQGEAVSRESDTAFKLPLSEKQVAVLTRNGIEGIHQMSRRRASLLIGKIMERVDKGLASYPQIKAMITLGVEPKLARTVSFEEASAIINKLGGRR